MEAMEARTSTSRIELTKADVIGITAAVMTSKIKRIDVTTPVKARKFFNQLTAAAPAISPAARLLWNKVVAKYRLLNETSVMNFFRAAEVRSAIHADVVGRGFEFVETKVEKNERIIKKIKDDLKGLYTFDEIEITNPDNTFVVRNADGLGDPMFVDGGEEFISDHMHELSMLYKAMTGTPYYDARPIKYTTWLANPDRRERTRTVEIDVKSIDID